MDDETKTRPLDDAQRRLEAVLDNATVAILLMDDRQHCVYMNKAAEDLTGYGFEEVRDLDCPLHDIVHHSYPDGRPFPLSDCAIDRAFPEHNQMQGEETFVRKDGTFYPVAFTASPIRDSASQTVGTIIELRDIGEQKRASERQQLLLNELNHRVKNSLATVQAIAWQTFRGSDPEVVDRFNGRIANLARAHSILTDGAWHKASLCRIVDEALRPFGLDRFRVRGEDASLSPKAAVSLSMVLHELATNAVKYGALSVQAGQVDLEWFLGAREVTQRLDLVWCERAGPEVKVPDRRGFGSRLIERQLGLEFGGEARLDFECGGLVCRMRLELPPSRNPLDDAEACG